MLTELRKVLPLRLQIATAFLFVMWLFFQAYVPWQAIDDDLLLETGQFNNVTDLSGWQRELGNVQWSDDTGFIHMTAASRFRYELPLNTGDYWLVSGRMQTSEIEFRRNKWDAARILIYFENARGEINWSYPHNVGYAYGSNEWTTYRELIAVPYWAKTAWLELAHYGRGGSVSFDDISVKPAVWKPSYKHWQMAFGMSWAAIMMWLVLNTHFWSIPWGRLLLFNAVLIIVGVTLPPSTMFQVASSGVNLTKKIFVSETAKSTPVPKVATVQTGTVVDKPVKSRSEDKLPFTDVASLGRLAPRNIQKAGHALLFASMAFFAIMAFAGAGRNRLVIYALVLFAISTEVLQLIIVGRTSSLFDLSLDLVGLLSGIVVAYLWLFYRNNRASV